MNMNMNMNFLTSKKYSVGRRKVSVARVRIIGNSTDIVVNNKDYKDYFCRDIDRLQVLAALSALDLNGKVGLRCLVNGGGSTGQSNAIKLAVSRALLALNPDFRKILRSNGYLTRDSRMVESKRYGRRKSRRSFQFAKR